MAQSSAAAPIVSHHRRTYLVDRAFQLKYTVLLMATGLLVALLFALWIYQAYRQVTVLVAIDPSLRPEIQRAERQLLMTFLGIAVLMSAALGLVGVLLTHRVAGPVFVMGHYMSVLAEGRYPRMRTLRRNDELKAFFEVFLRAVDRLKTRDAQHVTVLEDAVSRMRATHAPGLEPAIQALEAAIRERRASLAADDPEPTPQWVPGSAGFDSASKR
jgi:hypothetical protein